MKRKIIFAFVVALLLAPWPVAYAHDDALAMNSPANIEPAEEAAAPKMNVFGHAIGGITAGDLFYIDSDNMTADTHYTLYITNTDELVNQYRYMNLKIGIYRQTDADRWEEVTWGAEEEIHEVFITMQSGITEFILPGYNSYKITIDSGCFYCYGVDESGIAAIPKFYLTST